MKITWLQEFVSGWSTRVEQARVPHAVMLLGAAGSGKRAAAAWLARERLGLAGAEDGPSYPVELPEHADLFWVKPPPDKHAIGIEQIRELVADLSLTSYEGGGKVAVIEPANAMTASAANSLLKTLEEPPGDALMILIADRIGRLPATVQSRCQRIRIELPDESESLDWLGQYQAAPDWPEALRLAANAPLAALEARDRLERARSMDDEFAALAAARLSPIDVAARWARYEPDFVLDWLCHSVQRYIRRAACGDGEVPASGPADSVLSRIDRRNLFCYLDTINRLRGQAAGSFNVQLTFESLLIDWAGGLASCQPGHAPGERLPGIAE